MLTYTNTLKKFTDSLYTSFELGYFESGKREPLRIIKHTGESPEEAQEILKREVAIFPQGTRFEVAAKKNAKDTNDTAHVWQFTNVEQNPATQAAPVPGWPAYHNPQAAGFGGFGGFGGFPMMGIDPQELKEERRRLEELKERLQDEKFSLKLAEAELKRKEEKHADQVARDREILTELEKKFKSTTGAAQKGAELLLGEALQAFSKDGHFGSFAGRLMGVPTNAALNGAEEQTAQLTPEHQEIEKLAEFVAEQNLTVEEIKKLRGMIAVTIKKWKDGVSETKD